MAAQTGRDSRETFHPSKKTWPWHIQRGNASSRCTTTTKKTHKKNGVAVPRSLKSKTQGALFRRDAVQRSCRSNLRTYGTTDPRLRVVLLISGLCFGLIVSLTTLRSEISESLAFWQPAMQRSVTDARIASYTAVRNPGSRFSCYSTALLRSRFWLVGRFGCNADRGVIRTPSFLQ